MFKNVETRFILRCMLAGLLAASGALSGALVDGSLTTVEGIIVSNALIAGALTYGGIGYAVPQVEPSIGATMEEREESNGAA